MFVALTVCLAGLSASCADDDEWVSQPVRMRDVSRSRPRERAAEILRNGATRIELSHWRSCTERRASYRRRDPKPQGRELTAFVRRRSRSKAIRLPAAARRGSEPNVVLAGLKRFCAAVPVDVLACDPESFGALFPGAPRGADSFATLPIDDPDNPRRLGFSCQKTEARFMPRICA